MAAAQVCAYCLPVTGHQKQLINSDDNTTVTGLIYSSDEVACANEVVEMTTQSNLAVKRPFNRSGARLQLAFWFAIVPGGG